MIEQDIHIKKFLEGEKTTYNNQHKEDYEHLLPITRNRLEEKFGGQLTDDEIDKYMESFEKLL